MKVKNCFRRFFAGMGIGTGAAIPGVSGAAVAVIFKVYEEIITAVNNFRKKFGYAIAVLVPILLGIICAVIPCIILFSFAFEHFLFLLISLFAGFLLGSFPGVLDEVKGVNGTGSFQITGTQCGLIVYGDIAELKVFDLSGKQVAQSALSQFVNLSHVGSGIYVVQIKSKSGRTATRKIIRK